VAQQIAHIGPPVRLGGAVARPGATVVSVALARLVVKRSIREAGVNQEHVHRLMRLGGRWPPILVHETTGVVIDGVHRVAAARMLGLLRIDASLFSGGPNAALIEFVRRNVQHGLPLTLRERKWAAGRVLSVHPDWSDRRIAGICALSPKTVARLRVVSGACDSDHVTPLDVAVRVGRDNRLRPVDSGLARERVAEALKEHPRASLRSVAALVGVSPETVRSVRLGLATAGGEAPADRGESLAAPGADRPILDVVADDDPSSDGTREDAPARSLSPVPHNASALGEFVSWFHRTGVDADECSRWVSRVPPAYCREVAAEAHRRAQAWLEFATALSTRADTSA
jgi:ParB-like chromosome segregation protein Spo0J